MLAAFNSAWFPIFFNYISELFPTRMRGMANAIILFSGKMIGSFAPILATLSKNRGFHVLCGCSLMLLISLPLSFCTDETFIDASENSDTSKTQKQNNKNDFIQNDDND